MVAVSVVVPTYNRADTLPRALRSATDQTYGDTEIIVVDDASTDRTERVVTEQFPEVEYVRHDTNRGGSAARNTGIEAANGEYIAFLDSDDEWHSEKLARQVERLRESDDDCGVVYTRIRIDREDGSELGNAPTASGDIYHRQLARDYVGPTSSVLVRQTCFETVGGFREDLAARQDYEMWLRLSREFAFIYLEEPLTVLHTDSSNRISEQVTDRISAHQTLIEEIREEISAFDAAERHRILSTQYYTLARYCQKNRQQATARRYFLKSLRISPTRSKSWAGLALSLTPLSTREGAVLRLKSRLRADD